MPNHDPERLAELEAEQHELVFPAFDHADAWRLGCRITETALEAEHPVVIDIRRPGLVLFRAALAGSAPDQEEWVRGKSAVVFRMDASTALVAERLAARGMDPTQGWLPFPEYAVAGGSVPVRVAGVGVVAAVTVSGLASDDDHRLVVDGMRAYLDEVAGADAAGDDGR
jgi:uncharacterized protein (UPF0303 family)